MKATIHGTHISNHRMMELFSTTVFSNNLTKKINLSLLEILKIR